jgi:hypothetical protein
VRVYQFRHSRGTRQSTGCRPFPGASPPKPTRPRFANIPRLAAIVQGTRTPDSQSGNRGSNPRSGTPDLERNSRPRGGLFRSRVKAWVKRMLVSAQQVGISSNHRANVNEARPPKPSRASWTSWHPAARRTPLHRVRRGGLHRVAAQRERRRTPAPTGPPGSAVETDRDPKR